MTYLTKALNTREDLAAWATPELKKLQDEHDLEIVRLNQDIETNTTSGADWRARAKYALSLLRLHRTWLGEEVRKREKSEVAQRHAAMLAAQQEKKTEAALRHAAAVETGDYRSHYKWLLKEVAEGRLTVVKTGFLGQWRDWSCGDLPGAITAAMKGAA